MRLTLRVNVSMVAVAVMAMVVPVGFFFYSTSLNYVHHSAIIIIIVSVFFVPGDRWLVSCLGVLYLSKGLFYRVVPADQNFSTPDHYVGVFRFRLWWCGEWVEVLVDDRLPTVHGRLAFLQSTNSDQFWPGLLEKAYAK